MDYTKTIAAVVRAAGPTLADICVLDVIADDGQIERVAVLVADPEKQHLIDRIRQFVPERDSMSPAAESIRSGKASLHERFRARSLDGARAELTEEIGLYSVMAVPLVARGRTFGALFFGATKSGREYSSSDLAVAEEIGRRAAIAVDNAQLYERAQRATQARQDLLAMVSHDLKNPLNTILMSTTLLDTTTPGELGEIQRAVGMIRRAAHRMNRLLGDLLDIASLESGHVFDRFWQARKTARMGTGLGLTIAKGLVEAHHGRIWAESAQGKGATLFFTIPVVGRVSK